MTTVTIETPLDAIADEGQRVDAALRRIVAERGPSLVSAPDRLRALLLDECPDARLAINSVVDACTEGIVTDLARADREPLEAVLPRLAERLQRERSTEPAVAQWAVATWARALGHHDLPLPPITVPAKRSAPAQWSAAIGRTPRWLRVFGAIIVALLGALLLIPSEEPISATTMAGALAPDGRPVTKRPGTFNGAPAIDLIIPVVTRGARKQRCEVQTWWYYRRGAAVQARTRETGHATPNGQIGRMAYFHPSSHDDTREVHVAFPLAAFPERDATRQVDYDLVTSISCGGRLLADRVRRPIVDG